VEIDWEAHRALIEARIAQNAKTESNERRVDDLLAEWVATRAVSDIDLRDSVLAEIRQSHRAARPIRWVIRLGLPLAAAAAIAIAILVPNWKSWPGTRTISIVQIGPESRPLVADVSSTVVFERTTVSSKVLARPGESMEIMVVGSAPAAPIVEESAQL